MVTVCFDLRKNQYGKMLPPFLTKIILSCPANLRKTAVVDIQTWPYTNIETGLFDAVYGTYGAVLREAQIFIECEDVEYPNIAKILMDDSILSVFIGKKLIFDFFDIYIESPEYICWDNIIYNYKKKYSLKLNKSRKNIAFITPMNIDKSAIAKYSTRTLEELCKIADVDVFSLEKTIENKFNAKNISYINAYPYLTDSYDAVISVLGDSIYHDKMTQYFFKYGGYSIVHDSNLLNYHYSLFGLNYIKNIARFYNNEYLTDSECINSLRDFSNLKVTALEPVIENSKIFFTHSKKLYNNLIKKYNNISYLPFCIHNNINDKYINYESKCRYKEKLGYSKNDILIVSFGYIASHKKSDIILKGFMNAKKNNNVKCAFVGALVPSFTIFKDIANKAENVRYYENFVDNNIYEDYIYAADIAIQLRNTTNGQVSGALSDNISGMIYTITCEDLAQSIDAPSYIYGISGNITEDIISEKIEEVLKSCIYKNDFTKEKDHYISEHNFTNYVKRLVSCI